MPQVRFGREIWVDVPEHLLEKFQDECDACHAMAFYNPVEILDGEKVVDKRKLCIDCFKELVRRRNMAVEKDPELERIAADSALQPMSQSEIDAAAGPRVEPGPEPEAAMAPADRVTVHYADGRMRGAVRVSQEDQLLVAVFDDNGETEEVLLGDPHPCLK